MDNRSNFPKGMMKMKYRNPGAKMMMPGMPMLKKKRKKKGTGYA